MIDIFMGAVWGEGVVRLVAVIADAASPSAGFDWAQYGPIGVVLSVMVGVVKYQNGKLEQQYTERIKKAEDAEADARKLADDAQLFIRDRLLPALEKAALAAAKQDGRDESTRRRS